MYSTCTCTSALPTPCSPPNSQSRHMEFNFPPTVGSGIAPLLKHASGGCVDLIAQLCTYDPDERPNAKHALRHPYFKDLRCVVVIGVISVRNAVV